MLHTPLVGDSYFSVALKGVGINGAVAYENSTNYLPAIVDTGNPMGISLPVAWLQGIDDVSKEQACEVDSDCVLNVKFDGLCLNVAGLIGCNATTSKCTVPTSETAFTFSSEAMIGFELLKDLYIELDRQHDQIGFAARSGESCRTPCSAVLTEVTCGFTDGCSWDGARCAGGMSQGSLSSGSTVGKESECFVLQSGGR